MTDVVDRQEELEVMLVHAPAIFSTPVGHDPQHRQVVFLMERQHAVIEQISRSDRCLGGVELGMRHLGISLLIDPPNALDRADVEGVMRSKIARETIQNSVRWRGS